MGRLFTSELDKMLYSEQFVALINQFYDRVDAIQEASKAELPQGIELNDTFEFLIADKKEQGIEFNDRYDLPQPIMNAIFEEFKSVFKKQA
jgi:hypothetical protein